MSRARKSAALQRVAIPETRITRLIVMARGQKVLLDRDLALLYGVETRALNQAVKRHRARFPNDFMIALTRKEIHGLADLTGDLRLKKVRALYAFTEQGVAMLSGVLNSSRAVQVNIAIMRAFVQLRELLATLERNYDARFKAVFEAIRALMEETTPVKRGVMGFHTLMPAAASSSGAKNKRLS